MFRLVGALFAVCASLCAQSNFATLSGRIQDPSQAPVSGARVTVTSKATDAVRRSTTNDQGLFETPNLVPGEYSVEVSKPGFAVQTHTIVLEVGSDADVMTSLAYLRAAEQRLPATRPESAFDVLCALVSL